MAVEDIWEDFKVESLAAANKQVAAAITSKWNDMKKRILSCELVIG